LAEWRPHSEKQELALFFSTIWAIIATGVQWGKTEVLAIWMKMQMHTFTDPSDNFILTSPSFPIMSQSTLPPFLALMEGLGRHDKKFNCFVMNQGGTCWFRTGTDPDSVVGIRNTRAVGCDEMGKYSLYFWQNIQGRAAPRAARILGVTSPYTLNFLYKEFIKPKALNPNARPDVTLIQAKSIENPYFSRERYEMAEKTMDPRRFAMMFGGEWGDVIGRVYDCFDEVENQCKPFVLPAGTRYVGGIDWGHTHAFVFKIRAITPDGRHFGVHEFYKTGLTISDIVTAVKRLCQVYDVSLVYCAPERPENILELNRAGVSAIPADNSVRLGIDRHYELLKTRRLKYFEGMNPYTLDELASYHYAEPEELRPDQNAKDRDPVKQNDDAVDADRYISVMTFLRDQKTSPFVPQEVPKKSTDPHKDLARLLKGPRKGGAEEWG